MGVKLGAVRLGEPAEGILVTPSGGLDQVKEACRDVRRPPALADLGADVRFAWRTLAKDRWFTAGAILTLALAMGVANTTFISTYATLWRDFPFERPDRIAIMRTVDGRGREAGLSYPDDNGVLHPTHHGPVSLRCARALMTAAKCC